MKRILSGMRPTGKLHLGHYTGALENWITLQHDFENYHLVADWHVLTTSLNTSSVYEDTIDMVIDWLAAGLDPMKSPMFRQSRVKEHTELHLILSMLITVNRLERNPTVKDQIRDLNIENITYGHLGYPVLQAADILLYKGDFVPVGEDQVPHIEIARELARRFNQIFGPVFPEPEPKLTQFSRLVGLDGNAKMSKSLGNALLLSDDPETVKLKLRKAVTDPQKMRKGDPGRPEICLVFSYHRKYNQDECQEISADCKSGKLGCVDCKLRCASRISEFLDPIIERRKHYEANKDDVISILCHGEECARKVAQKTMDEVHNLIGMG